MDVVSLVDLPRFTVEGGVVVQRDAAGRKILAGQGKGVGATTSETGGLKTPSLAPSGLMGSFTAETQEGFRAGIGPGQGAVQTTIPETLGADVPKGQTNVLLQTLNHRHKAVAEFALQGKSAVEIGKLVGYTPEGVRGILKQPVFQDYIARMRDGRAKTRDDETSSVKRAARELIESATLGAAQVQLDLLGNEDPKIKLAVSESILNRAYKNDAPEVNRSQVTLQMDSDLMARFLTAVAESGLDAKGAVTRYDPPSPQQDNSDTFDAEVSEEESSDQGGEDVGG